MARMSDSDIVAKVTTKSKEAVGWYDSRLSKERTRVLDYYNAKLPRKQTEGGSGYVSTDVYDSVEMLKSQLLETFAGGDEIAQFDPDQDMDAEQCRVATEYARYVIFRENNGYQIFNDVIHDGLTARTGITKVFWDERYTYDAEEFSNLTEDEVNGLAAQDEVDSLDAEQQDDGLYKGSLTRKVDQCQITLTSVAPESFLISPRAVSIKLAGYHGERELKTKAELLEEGYDPEKVKLVHYDDAKGLDMSPEVLARQSAVETYQAVDNAIQPEMEQVSVYESYVRMEIEKGKGVRLYRIIYAGDVLLEEPQEVNSSPYFPYVPLPVAHMFHGNNFAQRVIPTQNARTVLARAILDHAAITVNPRWGVVKGGVPNPRELIDNRRGGIVNIARPDSILPLATANLNPYVFELMQQIGEMNEKSTGISALSQGLNKDAISKQNSRGLIGDLVTLSTQRQKIAARNFAYNYFVPIMLEVIRLAILHEKKTKVIEVAGNWTPINPKQWSERTSCAVSMHLGYGEKDAALEKLTKTYQFITADPVLSTCFLPKNRYEMYRDATKMAGLSRASAYLTPPDQAPNGGQPQPDPMKTAETQAKLISAQAQKTNADAAVTKDERQSQINGLKLQHAETKMQIEAMESDRDANRHDLEAVHRVSIAERQMGLEERMRPKEVSAKMIVNPRA